MRKSLPFLLFIFLSTILLGQSRIDGSFAFQTDPAKKYSLYIPSGYDENTPHRLMLGLHPFNTDRWDAESWCDTLIVFAETNNLILACPDGGLDGQIDDSIDTAFTTALLDSMEIWYNINTDKVYAMGFSVGGRATYTYSMNHSDRIKGCIPIGAAVNGTDEVDDIIQNAEGKPYYILHGMLDAPAIRYTPIRTALIQNGAIVESILMSGVGHTIDFPNRNAILSEAYIWIDTVNCPQTVSVNNPFSTANEFTIYPNPVQKDQSINVLSEQELEGAFHLRVYSTNGAILFEEKNFFISRGSNAIPDISNRLKPGMNVLEISENGKRIKAIPFLVF